MRFDFGLIFLFLGCGAAWSSPPVVPSTAPTIPKVTFSQETLSNGLRVVYAPRRGWPTVNVRVVYHVGSKDEPADRRGLAHLVEHLMFRGSAHITAEERSRVLWRAGGRFNGETVFDTTSYWETLPSNQLDLALWLEAERMAKFEIDQTSLDAERRIVEEEWAQHRGVPFLSLTDDALPLAGMSGPYHWSPIGDMEQLRSVSVRDAKEFVARWYGPNNAVLVVTGDFDVAKAQATARRFFGWIAPRATPARNAAAQVASTQPRVLDVTGSVPWPSEVILFPLPEYAAADEPAVRMLARLLAGDWNSHLVASQRPLASLLNATPIRLESGGLLIVSAAMAPGQKFDALSDAVFVIPKLLFRFLIQKNVSDAAGYEALEAEIGRETTDGVGRELGISTALRGQPGWEDQELAAMGHVGAGRLGKMALAYFDQERAVTLHVMPGAVHRGSSELEEPIEEPSASEVAATMPSSIPASMPTTRHVAGFGPDYPESPPEASGPVVTAEAARFEKTMDGVHVVVMPDSRTDAVHWAMVMRHRIAEPKGKEGVASLTAQLLSATIVRSFYDPRARPRDLELAGTSDREFSSSHRTVLLGDALPAHADDALELTQRRVFDPDLLKPDFYQEAFFGQRLRGYLLGMIAAVERTRMDASALAWEEIEKIVLRSPPRRPTTRSIASLTIEDARDFYQRAYGNVGLIVVAGNVTRERGMQIAQYLLDGRGAATRPVARKPGEFPLTTRASVPVVPIVAKQPATAERAAVVEAASAATKPAMQREHDGLEIVLIDCPGVVQCPLRIVAPAFVASSPDAPAGAIAAHILADGLHSRMGRFVRCDRGYAYTTTAQFFSWRDGGYFLASADTEPQNVAKTATSVLQILADVGSKGVSDEELRDAKTALMARKVVQDESVLGRLMEEVRREFSGIRENDDVPTEQGYDAVVQHVAGKDVRDVMAKYAQPARMTIVVAGPAAKLRPALQRIGAVRVVEPGDETIN